MLGIKFSHYGQIYYFVCDDAETGPGDRVLAETGQGLGLGLVVMTADTLPPDVAPETLRPVVRRATEQDLAAAEENDGLAREAQRFCELRIRERELDMKLVDVEVLFDRSKLVFYFTAPTRIDFRELVKDLVREYHTRIELRQIGVRHETQMLGAVGSCGMVCCCRRFLRKFVPVTIKMAKEQNLFLNPAKISGICGRLLCCLSYEQENYDIFHRNCPRLGKRYQTNKGPVKILRANLFRNSIALLTETNEEIEVSLDEWRELDPRRPDVPLPPRPERGASHTEKTEGAADEGSAPAPPSAPRGEESASPEPRGAGRPEQPARADAAHLAQLAPPQSGEPDDEADTPPGMPAAPGAPDKARDEDAGGPPRAARGASEAKDEAGEAESRRRRRRRKK